MKGHKDKSGKFHPHNNSNNNVSSKDIMARNNDDWIHRNFEHGLYSEDSPFGACNICHWSPSKLEEDALPLSSLYKIMGNHLEKEHDMKYPDESKAKERIKKRVNMSLKR